MKKWLKVVLCIVLALVLLAGGYVAYVFIDYHRIGDMALIPASSDSSRRAGGYAVYRRLLQHRLRRLRG